MWEHKKLHYFCYNNSMPDLLRYSAAQAIVFESLIMGYLQAPVHQILKSEKIDQVHIPFLFQWGDLIASPYRLMDSIPIESMTAISIISAIPLYCILLSAPTIKIIFLHIVLFRCPVFVTSTSLGKVNFVSSLPWGPVVRAPQLWTDSANDWYWAKSRSLTLHLAVLTTSQSAIVIK